MGLLGNLLRQLQPKNNQRSKYDPDPPLKVSPETLNPRKSNSDEHFYEGGQATKIARVSNRDIIINGTDNKNVYIYDGRPLSHIKDNRIFYLEATNRPVSLQSIVTGSEWSNIDGNGLTLLYDGTPVGFYPYKTEEFEQMLGRGFRVRFTAVKSGMYMPKIPNVTVRTPPYESFGHWVDLQSRLYDYIDIDTEVLSFNITAEPPMKKLYRNPIELAFQLRDPDPGSQAKPKIECYFNGEYVGAFSARSSYYKLLLPYAEQSTKHAIATRKDSMMDSGYYYAVKASF